MITQRFDFEDRRVFNSLKRGRYFDFPKQIRASTRLPELGRNLELEPSPKINKQRDPRGIEHSHRANRQDSAASDLRTAIDARGGNVQDSTLEPFYEAAVRGTISQLIATGSPVVTDGEQRKHHDFWTYGVHGLCNTAPAEIRARVVGLPNVI
jgi:hypothetical protein